MICNTNSIYGNKIALLEREIEKKYEEIEFLKKKLEENRGSKTPTVNGRGQAYLDYENQTNPNEVSEQ